MSQGQAHRKVLFWVQIVFGLGLGLAALYLALQGVNWQQVRVILSDVNLPLLALALVTALLTPVTKAIRWRFLFYLHHPSLNLTRLTGLLAIGQAINILLLGRWGDLARAYLTGEEAGISKSYVLGTVATEKLLDIIVLALLVIALIPFIALPSWLGTRVGYLVFGALIVSAAAATLLGGRRLWLRIASRVLQILPRSASERWQARFAAGLDGLAALGARKAAIAVWGWTFVVWLISALTNLLLLAAFHLPPSLLIAVFLLAVLQAGVAVPSTPGKIGVFQYLCVLSLSVFGVSVSAAFGYGVVLYLLVVGSICSWAGVGLWQRSVSLRRLAEASAGWQ